MKKNKRHVPAYLTLAGLQPGHRRSARNIPNPPESDILHAKEWVDENEK